MTGKGGPGSIAPPLVCCVRSTVVYVVQSTEFPDLSDLIFWKLSSGFSGSYSVIFWKLGKQLPIVRRGGGNVLISFDPINDQLADLFARAI